MSVKILYEEGDKSRSVKNGVYVQLRVWSAVNDPQGLGDYCDASDIVLETWTIATGQAKSSLEVFNAAGKSTAEWIRFAITRFDELVAKHPNKHLIGTSDGAPPEYQSGITY